MGESSLLPADLQHMGFKVGVYLPNREKNGMKSNETLPTTLCVQSIERYVQIKYSEIFVGQTLSVLSELNVYVVFQSYRTFLR